MAPSDRFTENFWSELEKTHGPFAEWSPELVSEARKAKKKLDSAMKRVARPRRLKRVNTVKVKLF